MIKRLFPIVLSVLLLSLTVHAAAATPDGASVTVTDITERQGHPLPEYLPTNIQAKTEDGVPLLLKTFEVGPEVSPSVLAEENLTHGGVEYELRDITRKYGPDGQEGKIASQTVTVMSESDKREDILPLLPESIEYAEDGFAGRLLLNASDITTEVESTEGYRYTVTDSREYPGLIRNDPFLIPKTVQKNGVSLNLTGVKWSPGADIDPNPASYHATAYYKGSAHGEKPSGFTATATYTGEVVKAVPGNVIYTLVYSAVPVTIEEETRINWTPALFGLGAVVILGGIGTAVVFAMRRRKTIPEYADEMQETPKKRMRIPNMLNELEDGDEQSY